MNEGQKPEAWEKCSTEEKIRRLSEYVASHVDWIPPSMSREDVCQQTALVYLEAEMNNLDEPLGYRQMCNHCLNRVRYYLDNQTGYRPDCELGLDEEAYLALKELSRQAAEDFLNGLDSVLCKLERGTYSQVWFDTYRDEAGIRIPDPERELDVADLSRPAIANLWLDSREIIERKIRYHVDDYGYEPESLGFALSCEQLYRLGSDSLFSKTFY